MDEEIKTPLTWTRYYAYERLAKINIEAAYKTKDMIERGYFLDLARKFAKAIGRNIERVPK